jgi:DNA processing protein
MLAVVGTRNATEYGKAMCERIIRDLRAHNPIIVSGLAFGIDVCAHKIALQEGLQTIAIIGSPLQRIHPLSHVAIADKIKQQGCVVSEYPHTTKYEQSLFVKRNRLIAGMSDATLVIESNIKGGSLITADFAQQYNREVFAVPGAVGVSYSSGCNMLIKQHKAAMVESGADIIANLNWDITSKPYKQRELFIDLDADETHLLHIVKHATEHTIDVLCSQSGFTMSKTSSVLLSLEFKGLITCLPGKRYVCLDR